MLWSCIRGQYPRVLSSPGQGGGLLAARRHPHLKLHLHDGLALHHRGHGLQGTGLCHRAHSANWQVIVNLITFTTYLKNNLIYEMLLLQN